MAFGGVPNMGRRREGESLPVLWGKPLEGPWALGIGCRPGMRLSGSTGLPRTRAVTEFRPHTVLQEIST